MGEPGDPKCFLRRFTNKGQVKLKNEQIVFTVDAFEPSKRDQDDEISFSLEDQERIGRANLVSCLQSIEVRIGESRRHPGIFRCPEEAFPSSDCPQPDGGEEFCELDHCRWKAGLARQQALAARLTDLVRSGAFDPGLIEAVKLS